MIWKLENPEAAAPFFAGRKDTLIHSALAGIMGDVYRNGTAAMVNLGDFCLFGGEPDKELASFRVPGHEKDYMILVPGDEGWGRFIEEAYGARAKKITRYQMEFSGPEAFSSVTAPVPEGFVLAPMDEKLYEACLKDKWSEDLPGQFGSFAAYEKMGLGVLALLDGKPVAGASSYSAFPGGIEIEIDTKQEFRRRGLARACGAALIKAYLERGLWPSWDAHTEISKDLAESLGYRLVCGYTAYEVNGY